MGGGGVAARAEACRYLCLKDVICLMVVVAAELD